MGAWLWWVVAALVLAVIELLSLDLVFIMLAGGALAAAGVAAAGGELWLQVIVGCAVTLLLLLVLRPWMLRHLRQRVPLVETNAAAHVGRTALVLSEVTQISGRVKLVGEVWSARLEDNRDPNSFPSVPVGTEVRVVRIEGATAVVAPVAAQHSA